MTTRASVVVGLRNRFSEGRVWLVSTQLYSALHVPNVLYGLPLLAMPIQVLLTFLIGSAFYVIRRMAGSLILPVVLHGLWDRSLFLGVATEAGPPYAQFAVYRLAVACAAAMLRKNWNTRLAF